MPSHVKTKKHKPTVVFKWRPTDFSDASSTSSRATSITMSATTESRNIPDLFTYLPPIRDLLNTQSSEVQDNTIQECVPLLAGLDHVERSGHGVPHLTRERHINFLHKSMGRLPAAYAAADANRPWMFYWAMTGLTTMGEDVSTYRQRMISTVRPIQNIDGGFGGGNGQMSHLATTYAAVLALAIVGGKELYDIIDRRSMWKWLGSLKMPDGGFQMVIGGEEDIRWVHQDRSMNQVPNKS